MKASMSADNLMDQYDVERLKGFYEDKPKPLTYLKPHERSYMFNNSSSTDSSSLKDQFDELAFDDTRAPF